MTNRPANASSIAPKPVVHPAPSEAPREEPAAEPMSPAWLSLCAGFVTGFVLAALAIIVSDREQWLDEKPRTRAPAALAETAKGMPHPAGRRARMRAKEGVR
jgi:hypothetical protein